MLKMIGWLVTFTIGLLGSSNAQQVVSPAAESPAPVTETDSKALKETFIQLEKQSWEAWKNHDSKFFNEFLSEDHVEVGFAGLSNKAQVVSFVGSGVCTVKSYKLDRFEMKLLDKNTALLTYWETQDTICRQPVPAPCWVSSLYMKRGDRWVNVFYQQTQTRE